MHLGHFIFQFKKKGEMNEIGKEKKKNDDNFINKLAFIVSSMHMYVRTK